MLSAERERGDGARKEDILSCFRNYPKSGHCTTISTDVDFHENKKPSLASCDNISSYLLTTNLCDYEMGNDTRLAKIMCVLSQNIL
jgi:hypothetical protein